VNRIPIQNLYYLFCYAWNRFEEGEAIDVGGVDSPELADLFAKVLIGGLKHLMRRGIDRGYIPIDEELSILRGRVNFQGSLQLTLRRKPRLLCQFDELRRDILTNQILKATILRLINVTGINNELAHELRMLARMLGDVSEPHLSRSLFRRVQIYRNNAFYDFLIRICELIYETTLPERDGDRYRFSDILRDEQKMARIFEDFVRNFYRLEQTQYRVKPLQMRWDAVGDENQLQMLPLMRTDIHLENANSRIIIDTKYYSDTLQAHHGKNSLRSENLYQLFSYLKNCEALGTVYSDTEGILLYPAVGDKIQFSADIQGHRVRVCTVNLDQPWHLIRSDLLAMIGATKTSMTDTRGIRDRVRS
jgi:5-methylcytosine-specific restriction enzyme subunit McrC